MNSPYDVVVVGARVAGASTALLLARAGLKVAMVDRTAYGSDTLSTHGLMRAGVLQLSRWQVLPEVGELAGCASPQLPSRGPLHRCASYRRDFAPGLVPVLTSFQDAGLGF